MDRDVFCDDGPPISRLQAAVRALDEYVHEVAVAPSTVTQPDDRNATANSKDGHTPVQLFGRQELVRGRWRELTRAHVAIYGLGAVGALAAEALVRAGVGQLLLVDSTRVELEDLSDMGTHPHEVGFSRVQALRLRLQSLSAHTRIDSLSADVANSDADLAELKKRLKASVNSASVGLFEALALKRPYDAVLCCATSDDVAKLRLNEACLQLSLPLLDVDVPPSNALVRLRVVLPGHTCCLACIQQQETATRTSTPMDQVARSIARAFPASLPHVDATAAGLIAQMAIKLRVGGSGTESLLACWTVLLTGGASVVSYFRFLLDVGDFVPFFTLNLLTFELESFSFPPSRTCPNTACVERQEEARASAY